MLYMQAVKKAAAARVSAQSVATIMLMTSLIMAGGNGVLASAVSLPSYQIVLLRAVLAAVILGVMLVASRKPSVALAHKGELGMLVGAGVALGADWLFLFEAYAYAGVGLATILCYCAPIIVMALSPFLFGERFTVPKVIGFVVVFAGAFLVNSSALQGGASLYGITCGLASAVCLALMMMLSKKAVHVVGLEKVFIEIAAAAAVVAVYAVLVRGVGFDMLAGIDVYQAIPIVLLGISTALGNFLYLKALDVLPAQSASVLGYAEPLSAVAFGAVFLGETLAPLQVLGAACIIGGALLSELSNLLHQAAATRFAQRAFH